MDPVDSEREVSRERAERLHRGGSKELRTS